MADEEKKINCGNTFTNVASYVIYYIVLLGLCYGLHLLLKPLAQPRIISETIVCLLSLSFCVYMHEHQLYYGIFFLTFHLVSPRRVSGKTTCIW